MHAKWENSKTIVQYSAAEPPFNAYPQRIVSPPRASTCCLDEMMALGSIHWDDDLPYVYRQCRVCGHTVRHFLDDAVETVHAS